MSVGHEGGEAAQDHLRERLVRRSPVDVLDENQPVGDGREVRRDRPRIEARIGDAEFLCPRHRALEVVHDVRLEFIDRFAQLGSSMGGGEDTGADVAHRSSV